MQDATSLATLGESVEMIATAATALEGAGLVKGVVNGLMKRGLGKSVAELVKKTACFTAGTQVWTADGLVPIEQVEPGQLVLSRDEATGELGWKRVVRTFATSDQATLALSLRDDERGEHEQVEATAEHPFWAEGRGWVGAGSLRTGERVLRADGQWLRVERVEAKTGTRTVYNLEVEGFHTYVVGQLGVWVHNAPCDSANAAKGVAQLTKQQAKKSIRTLEKRLAEHRDKLSKFKENPDAFDSKDFLKNAPSDEARKRIIDGRVKHLEQEIRNFESQLERLMEKLGAGEGGG